MSESGLGIFMGESMVGQCGIGSQQQLIKRGKQLIYLAVVKLEAS